MNNPLFIGLLSGTSMDAVDVAIVSFEQKDLCNPPSFQKPLLIASHRHPIPAEFKNRCFHITQTGQCSIDEYGVLDVLAGELFAEAVLKILQQTQISPSRIRAIGSHGQTLRHRPDLKPPFSLQIGDPNVISERTGILTIADFRRRDIAAGGQGAPLAPGLHASIFGNSKENRVIVNIGGISNMTILPADPNCLITGFDTGPGNCLMDAWTQEHLSMEYDRDSHFAMRGRIHEPLLEHCLDDNYFSEKPPKSSGREYFNLDWLTKKCTSANLTHIPAEDVQATLLMLTARTIANAIKSYAPKHSAVFICGGGAHNPFLMETLGKELQNSVNSTEILGVSPDWVEAILFAWLAKQTLAGKPGNCPSVTGASNNLTLGGIFGYCPNHIL